LSASSRLKASSPQAQQFASFSMKQGTGRRAATAVPKSIGSAMPRGTE